MSTLFLLLSTAYALDGGGVSLLGGSFAVRDPDWQVFSHGNAFAASGVRGYVEFGERVAVVGTWQYGARGATVTPGYIAAFRANELSLGGRYAVRARDWLHPYGSASAVALVTDVRFDANPDDATHDPSQVRYGGLAPGGVAMLGVDLRVPQGGAPFTFGAFVEVGWTALAPVRLGSAGDLNVGGFTANGGAGIRF